MQGLGERREGWLCSLLVDALKGIRRFVAIWGYCFGFGDILRWGSFLYFPFALLEIIKAGNEID